MFLHIYKYDSFYVSTHIKYRLFLCFCTYIIHFYVSTLKNKLHDQPVSRYLHIHYKLCYIVQHYLKIPRSRVVKNLLESLFLCFYTYVSIQGFYVLTHSHTYDLFGNLEKYYSHRDLIFIRTLFHHFRSKTR